MKQLAVDLPSYEFACIGALEKALTTSKMQELSQE
jgi:hypothetical protein